MRLDLDGDHEIARGGALVPGVALASQSDLLTIPDANRDACGDSGAVGGAQGHGRTLDGVAERQCSLSLDVGASARTCRSTKASVALLTLPAGIPTLLT